MSGLFKKALFLFLAVFLFPISVWAQLDLPQLISDGMVLQRNAEIKVWGWADEEDSVTVHFKNSTYQTVANNDGEWELLLPEMSAGGPYKMIVTSDTSVTIENIRVGEVWIGAGQSNMELSMSRVRPLYEDEISSAQNDEIRFFDVPQDYNFQQPEKDIGSGEWQETNPQNVLDFSAVAYFFAKKLYREYGVPIGIINTSVGGSPAESWISEKTLQEEFPEYYQEAKRFKDPTLIDSIQHEDQKRRTSWYSRLNAKDKGLAGDKGWHDPALNADGWDTMNIPGYWSNEQLGDINGAVWFRKEIEIPADWIGKSAKLLLGRAVDSDSVFMNGQFVGTTGYQYPPRRYHVPKGLLKEGSNTFTVRVINERGQGGFIPDKPYKLVIDGEEISLGGEWKYKLGAKMGPLDPQTFIRWKPLGLYNAIIAPIQKYRMRGVIWYQGESNTDRPMEYRDLFSTLIEDWRTNWKQDNFPFLYVQLANFMEPEDQPTESNWAMLREAQRQTLSVPRTGMAVTIDIGEWNDIHPLNKKDVGHRLALSAQKITYGDDGVIASGPRYQSMEIEGDQIVLTFDKDTGDLVAKGDGPLKEFSIAGADCNFVWAEAEIADSHTIIVKSDKIENPKVVRYAWADNPENANLYNDKGLPASPFSTNGLKGCQE